MRVVFFFEASITMEWVCEEKNTIQIVTSRCQSRVYNRYEISFCGYRTSVLQLISVASAAVSSSIKVFSSVTSLIKSTTTTTKDSYENWEDGLLTILFHPTRYYNESNRDPILIGGSLRRYVSVKKKNKNKKPKRNRKDQVMVAQEGRRKERRRGRARKKYKEKCSFMLGEVARLILRRFPCLEARDVV